MEKSAHFNLLQTAMKAVVEASGAILTIYNGGFSASYKTDGSPVTQADYASNEIIEKHLETTGIPVLSEENEHAPFDQRKKWKQLWCVDPLDGTKEFLKRNDEFAINIALIENGSPTLGLIADVVKGKILIGGKNIPAAIVGFEHIGSPESWTYLEPKTEVNTPLVVAGSRRPHSGATLEFVNELKAAFGDLEFLCKGSSLKFFDVALGTADIYPRFAPTMEWDIASGQAIIEALGGTVTIPETGKPMVYNKESLFNPHFVARSKATLNSGEK